MCAVSCERDLKSKVRAWSRMVARVRSRGCTNSTTRIRYQVRPLYIARIRPGRNVPTCAHDHEHSRAHMSRSRLSVSRWPLWPAAQRRAKPLRPALCDPEPSGFPEVIWGTELLSSRASTSRDPLTPPPSRTHASSLGPTPSCDGGARHRRHASAGAPRWADRSSSCTGGRTGRRRAPSCS